MSDPMNDKEYGRRTAPDTVRLERRLPGPIERVWRYLTDAELRGRWLAAGPAELRPGGGITLGFHHASLSDEDDPPPAGVPVDNRHTVHGTITRCEPPRLLTYTWGDDGEVTFELTAEGDAVRLVVTHVRLTPAQLSMVAAGWHTHLGLLADDLDGTPRRAFWRAYHQHRETYTARFGAPDNGGPA